MKKQIQYDATENLSFGCVDTHIGIERLLTRDCTLVPKKAFTYGLKSV